MKAEWSPVGGVDPKTDASLRHSLKDAAAFATMVGIGETYLSAFALFLKASTPQIGLLASLPPLLASFVQLFSAWLGHFTGQRKMIVLIGASLQAFAWLPLVLLPILFRESAVPLLIAAVVVYQCGAHLSTPQWGSMMGDIVPTRRRGRFFARRTRIVSLVTFIALMTGGLTLHVMSKSGHTLQGFLMLFGIAMLARLVSVYHLSKMHDPTGHVAAIEVPVGAAWWQRLRQSNYVRVLDLLRIDAILGSHRVAVLYRLHVAGPAVQLRRFHGQYGYGDTCAIPDTQSVGAH